MSPVFRKVSVIITLLILNISCVNQKQYFDLIKNIERINMNVESSFNEINELQDIKFMLESQIAAKNLEIKELEQQVNAYKRQNKEIGLKYNTIDAQMKKMKSELDAKKNESDSLVNCYKQKFTQLQTTNVTLRARILSSRIKTLTNRKVKSRKSRLVLATVSRK